MDGRRDGCPGRGDVGEDSLKGMGVVERSAGRERVPVSSASRPDTHDAHTHRCPSPPSSSASFPCRRDFARFSSRVRRSRSAKSPSKRSSRGSAAELALIAGGGQLVRGCSSRRVVLERALPSTSSPMLARLPAELSRRLIEASHAAAYSAAPLRAASPPHPSLPLSSTRISATR